MTKSFAIVGCGHIAERHVKHINDHSLAQLVGVYDIVESRSTEFASKYGVKYYDSLEALLEDTSIDVVNVCTPNGSHADLANQVMEAGKDVLVEKPMAITANSAAEMVETANRTGRKMFVVKQNRYNPPVVEVKKMLSMDVLGDVLFVSVNCFWNRNDKYYTQSKWRGTKALDGGTLFTQFSHFVDILYYLFGDIEAVSGAVVNAGHQDLIEFEDTGTFSFRFKRGGLGNLAFTTCAHEQNMEGSITIFARNGTVKIGGKYLNTIDYYNIEGVEQLAIEQSSPANNYGFYEGSMSNHDKVINNVVEALNGREEIMTTGEEGLRVVEMITALYESAKR